MENKILSIDEFKSYLEKIYKKLNIPSSIIVEYNRLLDEKIDNRTFTYNIVNSVNYIKIVWSDIREERKRTNKIIINILNGELRYDYEMHSNNNTEKGYISLHKVDDGIIEDGYVIEVILNNVSKKIYFTLNGINIFNHKVEKKYLPKEFTSTFYLNDLIDKYIVTDTYREGLLKSYKRICEYDKNGNKISIPSINLYVLNPYYGLATMRKGKKVDKSEYNKERDTGYLKLLLQSEKEEVQCALKELYEDELVAKRSI